MVALVFDRTDSGSVAAVLVGDLIVVRVHARSASLAWMLEDAGGLSLEATERADGQAPVEQLFRFRAAEAGKSTLRLVLRDENAAALDSWVLAVTVHDELSPSVRLWRKKR